MAKVRGRKREEESKIAKRKMNTQRMYHGVLTEITEVGVCIELCVGGEIEIKKGKYVKGWGMIESGELDIGSSVEIKSYIGVAIMTEIKEWVN